MIRFILLTIANLALPFVIRALYIYGMRLLAKHQNKKGMKNVTPPEWHFPVRKLLIIGFILLLASLGAYRFLSVEVDTSFVGNIVKTGDVE